MRISRLRICNFRSVKHLDIALPQVCALVGPNNAGKSNILLAIHRVIARDWVSVSSFEEADVYGRNPDEDIRIALSLEPPIQYVKLKGTDPAEIKTLAFQFTRYKVGDEKGQRRLEQGCLDAKEKPPMVLAKKPKAGEAHQYQPLVNIPSEVREAIPAIFIGTNRSLKDHLPGARYSLLRQLFEDIDRDFHDPQRTVKLKGPDLKEIEVSRSRRFETLMEEVMSLLRTDAFQQLENAIKTNALRQLGFDVTKDADKLDFFFSPFTTMEFYKSLDLYVREKGFAISATELGEGMQNALVLSILQAFEERRKQGAILLIEEPEMFLHPQMQRSLYKTIREIAKTNQVIYTTHSPHFVSVPDYQEVMVVRKGSDGTTVSPSSLPADAKRREKLIKELDPERNELFFATRLLLVEGDTEKLALPQYAKRINFDLDREGATIVEVGGKRNLHEFARIAASFGIPTGVLYDEDSSDFKDDKNAESQYNAALDALATASPVLKVWRLSKTYEHVLKATVGDQNYQALCEKFPSVGKPTRARLIAMENDVPVPAILQEVLNWLAGK